jgi:hypothetical protein
MPSSRFGPHPAPRRPPICHNCGNKMAPDLGNLCPDCKPVVLGGGKPIPPLGCLLLALAIGAALSVWFLNL